MVVQLAGTFVLSFSDLEKFFMKYVTGHKYFNNIARSGIYFFFLILSKK